MGGRCFFKGRTAWRISLRPTSAPFSLRWAAATPISEPTSRTGSNRTIRSTTFAPVVGAKPTLGLHVVGVQQFGGGLGLGFAVKGGLGQTDQSQTDHARR